MSAGISQRQMCWQRAARRSSSEAPGQSRRTHFVEPLRVKQFARMRDAVNDLAIRVAGVFLVETAQRGLETL